MITPENLFEQNLDFVEDLYARYLEDPGSVDARWREVFQRVNGGQPARHAVAGGTIFRPRAGGEGASHMQAAPQGAALAATVRMAAVTRLVEAYRRHGHLVAQLDPLGTPHDPRPHPELELATYGLTARDQDAPVLPEDDLASFLPATIGELHAKLRATYTRHIGVETSALDEPEEIRWLLTRMEATQNRRALSREQQLRILSRLVAAEGIEQFLHRKYVGTKRFSLEGAETLVPLLDLLIEGAADLGNEHVVLGMTHRGRLNVLVNVLGKDPADLLAEFDDVDPESTLGSGDVKYHLGFSADYPTLSGKRVHLTLSFNPSHLEAVDPVVLGRVRGKQDRLADDDRGCVLGVLLHGDAAFAGQGLIPESMNLAALKGYRTGGTIHVVVNNQIGFTTSPRDSRSTIYATDVALAAHCPIFHVNGEDPEAVAQVVALAVEFRQTFKKDVVLDMYCFRKFGHNEGDEPSFTQPLLYKKIEAHPSATAVYAASMIEAGKVAKADVDRIVADNDDRLEKALARARAKTARPHVPALTGSWSKYRGGPDTLTPEADTGVPREELEAILERLVTLPPDFHAHPKIVKLLEARAEARTGARPLDWGLGEALAFGSLVLEGARVRLSGQDSRRGTFSHRHAVLTDVETGAEYAPLANLRPGQAPFEVFDSALSEAAVLGFDYGYSLEWPDGLTLWEAQFGDFANGAQVMIDQFISSAEDKWKQLAGLVLLLPHGYEGQGPEHSSARIERWLTLSAEDGMQVCQPTTPAQLFHLLRRQVVRPWRKPLVVMTPKSLLRHPKAVSALDELATGRFQRVIPDPGAREGVTKRVLLCTGKIYYDLVARREKLGASHVAVVRLEQLYPFPEAAARAAIPAGAEAVWVQEEPLNMGAWTFILSRYPVAKRLVSRPESASPATGSAKAHVIEQEQIFAEAFR
jgi:2-oxoglutarate dehydrogenase E1 component